MPFWISNLSWHPKTHTNILNIYYLVFGFGCHTCSWALSVAKCKFQSSLIQIQYDHCLYDWWLWMQLCGFCCYMAPVFGVFLWKNEAALSRSICLSVLIFPAVVLDEAPSWLLNQWVRVYDRFFTKCEVKCDSYTSYEWHLYEKALHLMIFIRTSNDFSQLQSTFLYQIYICCSPLSCFVLLRYFSLSIKMRCKIYTELI